MTDKVYPSAKPAAAVNGGANPTVPVTKAQLYGATLPTYRPHPYHRRWSRRSCCCTLCLWFLLVILLLLFLIGVAGSVLYLLYRPHRPSFTVDSLKLSYLNITSSSTLNSKFHLNFTAKNPNEKVDFVYGPISISVFSDGVDVGDGRVPSFEHGKRNTKLLSASISSNGIVLDSDFSSRLKANLKNKNGFVLKVKLDTMVKAKMGGFKTPNVGIRLSCDGVKVSHSAAGKKSATAMAATSGAKCEVDVRFKIWKWTVG